jgi:hypothetical protein
MSNEIKQTYKIGDELNIRVKVDEHTIIYQTLIITYAFSNILLTCGHCLPSNSDITNGTILYTSGYQTDSESEEIGIIQLNNQINIIPNYKLLRPRIFITFKQLSFNRPLIKLINRSKSYNLCLIKLFDYESFGNLELNKINKTDDIYWLHAISRILNKPNVKSKLSDLFDLSIIGIACPTSTDSETNNECKTIKETGLSKSKLEKEFGHKIVTDKFYSITKPSFSGSPIIFNDYLIGYHLGSTIAYKLNQFNQIYWLGKIIYFKMISLSYEVK